MEMIGEHGGPEEDESVDEIGSTKELRYYDDICSLCCTDLSLVLSVYKFGRTFNL